MDDLLTSNWAEPTPQWPRPPDGGYTVEDLFTLPALPRHTEMIDGSLVFASRQSLFHGRVIDLLSTGLRCTVPPDLKVSRQMTVILDRYNGLEPDVSVIRAEACTGLEQDRYEAADVLLAVEVASPASRARDHNSKPRKYAASGIPNFWLVEMAGADKHPVVRVYELDPLSTSYQLTGIHHDRLKTGVPFTIDMDITLEALDQL
ncbi:Uma2 family endonuclease [Streptomyces sp. NPDC057539]|uniref:Uma2 family endonuclease n=1 Tax=Streptomyces sp. NPDC057539 TaxID=3346159 RepID=UPI0036A46807